MLRPRWAALPLVLAACSSGSDDGRSLSPDQEQRLNEAAEMLDANSVALEDVTTNEAQGAPEK